RARRSVSARSPGSWRWPRAAGSTVRRRKASASECRFPCMWGIFADLVVRRRRHARPMAGPPAALAVVPRLAGLPGSVRRRTEVAPPAAYAVVDVETTGTSVEADESGHVAV